MRSGSSLVAAVFLLLSCSSPFPAAAPSWAAAKDHPDVPAILDRAESLFQAMKAHDYPAIFAALSAKSRETIVAETTSAIAAAAAQAPPGKPAGADTPPGPLPRDPVPGSEAIRSDFVAGGPIARDYWDAFLRRFDPDVALEHSRWEIGSVKKDRAEILLTHHGATHPATLKMFREDGAWKVGLVETFWSR